MLLFLMPFVESFFFFIVVLFELWSRPPSVLLVKANAFDIATTTTPRSGALAIRSQWADWLPAFAAHVASYLIEIHGTVRCHFDLERLKRFW